MEDKLKVSREYKNGKLENKLDAQLYYCKYKCSEINKNRKKRFPVKKSMKNSNFMQIKEDGKN